MTMAPNPSPSGFGLIVIGTEILDGRVRDSHFENTRRLLQERSHRLVHTMILTDDPLLILDQLRWAMTRPEPFFCCGGIGSTPDDYTRQCAAEAAGVPLEHHEEGLRILKARFGAEATPARLRMVEFPRGAQLIPNPVNQIPGFTVANGHFLPGFPSMALPMAAWVLDNLYTRGEERITRTLLLPGAREGDLVGLMEDFTAAHPELTFSSLPHFVTGGTEVDLGLTGRPTQVEAGLADLTGRLDRLGQTWRPKA
jgi:molybdopterin-biosynthesis enzyme MoeA-like protein